MEFFLPLTVEMSCVSDEDIEGKYSEVVFLDLSFDASKKYSPSAHYLNLRDVLSKSVTVIALSSRLFIVIRTPGRFATSLKDKIFAKECGS